MTEDLCLFLNKISTDVKSQTSILYTSLFTPNQLMEKCLIGIFLFDVLKNVPQILSFNRSACFFRKMSPQPIC